MNKKLLAASAIIAMLSLASCGQSEEVVTPELDDTNVEMTEEVTPVEMTEEVAPVEMTEEVAPVEMTEEVIAE